MSVATVQEQVAGREGQLGQSPGDWQPLSHCPQVFVSKDVAKHFGFQSAEEALRGLYGRVRKG